MPPISKIKTEALALPGTEANGVERTEQRHHHPPPEGRVQVGEHGGARMRELVDALTEDDHAAAQHQYADKEPDGERLLGAGIDVVRMRCAGLGMGFGHLKLLGCD